MKLKRALTIIMVLLLLKQIWIIRGANPGTIPGTFEMPGDGVTEPTDGNQGISNTPEIVSWEDPQTLIDPYADVILWCVVQDFDTTPENLYVTLYYSNDTFGQFIWSEPLNYSSQTSRYAYRFVLTIPGQAQGVSYWYFFHVQDEDNEVTKPYEMGIYLKVQWDNPFAPGEPGGGAGFFTLENSLPILVIGAGIVTFAIIFIAILKRKKPKEKTLDLILGVIER